MALKEEMGLIRKDGFVLRFHGISPPVKYPAWPIIILGVFGVRSENAETWTSRRRIQEVLM
jgi:hypothetical protein